MKVFIDGENLRHRLVSVLLHAGRIHDSEDYFTVDVRKLIGDALQAEPEQILYFTTKVRQPEYDIPDKLRDKITEIQEQQSHWIQTLGEQNITVVKAGLLKVHESNACVHCGKRTLVLQEKGVDVRLATEMVMAAVHDLADTIVVFSSDADMIPALDVVRRSGTKVIYMCFEEEANEALRHATDRMVTYNRNDILQAARPHEEQRHAD